MLSGIVGIGGGIFLVPLLVIGFGLPQHLAQGTSLAAIIPGSAVGAATHLHEGNLARRAVIWLALGGVAGAAIGALVALHLPRELLGRVFGLLLIYSAFRMWPRRDNVEIDADSA